MMYFVSRRNAIGLAVAAAIHGTVNVALADDPGSLLEEVVVTATRRSTSVLDVPYNIQAFSSADLVKSGVTSVEDLVRVAPGLSVFDQGPRVSGNQNTFNIRGLNAQNAYNNDDNPSLTEAAVSTYFGEVPVFFPFQLVDMNRVEVLRGPQGTLYGDSSIGGTIRLIPNAPDPHGFDLTVNTALSATDYASSPSYDYNATVNIPINDSSAFRATFGHQYLSGFIDAVGLVRQTGTAMNPGAIVLQNPADFLNSPPAAAPADDDYNMAHIDYGRAALRLGVGDRVTVSFNFAFQENQAEGRYEDNPYYGNYQPYKYYTAFTDPQEARIELYDMDVVADLGFAQLTSATGVSNLDTDGVSDSSGFLRTNLSAYYFGYPRLYAPIKRVQHDDTYTEELRLVSTSGGAFDWIAGGFYRVTHNNFTLLQNAPGINQYTNEVLGLNPPEDFTDTLATGYSSTTFRDLAGYGELTWHITGKWQVTAGARVFHDTLEGVSGVPLPYASLTTQYFEQGVANNPYLLGGYYPLHTVTDDHIFKFNSSYKLTQDMLAYMTISQGFRPGGANALPASDQLGDNNRPYLLFRPDTDTNYEIGIKGSIDKRWSYSATAFLVNWQNFQATLYTPFGVNYIANVAPARSQGVELQLERQVARELSFGLSYSYIDAYVRKSFLMQQGEPATTVPAGSPLPGSAKNNFSGFVQYEQPLGTSSLTFRVDTSYKGPSQSNFVDLPTFDNDNFVRFSSVMVWGGSITWNQRPYSLALYGENLSNSAGTSEASAASLYGTRDQGYGVIRPRTIGLRFNWSYR
jgi:outer membrane receptor protein involved in Fe transport